MDFLLEVGQSRILQRDGGYSDSAPPRAPWGLRRDSYRTCKESAVSGTELHWVTTGRGVAMGWTEVDMSTPLFPEVVPEINANPMSFYSAGEGLGRSWFGV